MNAEVIRSMSTMSIEHWAGDIAVTEQLITLTAIVQELSAQLADMNEKTPSLRMRIAMDAIRGVSVQEWMESKYCDSVAQLAFKMADALIAVEKGGE